VRTSCPGLGRLPFPRPDLIACRRLRGSVRGLPVERGPDVQPPTIHAGSAAGKYQIQAPPQAKGATVSDIGNALSLSIKTVSTYRTRIMEKMGLQSNSDLTYYAMKNNLLD